MQGQQSTIIIPHLFFVCVFCHFRMIWRRWKKRREIREFQGEKQETVSYATWLLYYSMASIHPYFPVSSFDKDTQNSYSAVNAYPGQSCPNQGPDETQTGFSVLCSISPRPRPKQEKHHLRRICNPDSRSLSLSLSLPCVKPFSFS